MRLTDLLAEAAAFFADWAVSSSSCQFSSGCVLWRQRARGCLFIAAAHDFPQTVTEGFAGSPRPEQLFHDVFRELRAHLLGSVLRSICTAKLFVSLVLQKIRTDIPPENQLLASCGAHGAVDDFGTGYSSLSYLQKSSIHALKIDQSFVRRITTAPDETTIVTAVKSMARSLKLRVLKHADLGSL
jgi:hypothetical protein